MISKTAAMVKSASSIQLIAEMSIVLKAKVVAVETIVSKAQNEFLACVTGSFG